MYYVYWYDLDPIQSQGHWPAEVPKISTLAEATTLWLWLQVGRNKPCMLAAAMTISPLVGLFIPVHSFCQFLVLMLDSLDSERLPLATDN